MSQFVYNVITHPLFYIGFVLSFAAAFAFLIFLRGFLSGVGHLFTIDHHDEHLAHSRTRAVWGVVILYDVFFVWVAIRTLVSIFDGQPVNNTVVAFILLFFIVYRSLAWYLLPPAPKGH